MATEAQLRQRIRDLQHQIETLRDQYNTVQNDLNRKMNENFSRMRSDYERALTRQKNETETLYSNRLRAFQAQIIRQTREQFQALEQESERIVRQQNAKLAELSACNEELRDVLQRMKQHSMTVEHSHKRYAADLVEQLQTHRSRVQKTPHEFFYRGEFEIIDSHVGQTRDEIQREMYQAAAADASSVMMEFDLLKAKVEQALQEWEAAFRDYARIIKELDHRIKILEQHTVESCAGAFRMTLDELNYWSSGTFLAFKEKIQNAMHTVAEVEQTGVEQYLKNRNSTDRKGIFAKLTDARRWGDELSGITNCILSERLLSDERWFMAMQVGKQMQSIGYQIVKRGFRAPAPELTQLPWYPAGERLRRQNPLDCFDLVQTVQGLDMVRITFVPVRENGVTIRNDCIVSLDAKTLQDRELTDDVVQSCVALVKSTIQSEQVVGVSSGFEQEKKIRSEETQRKKEPNPRQQIQYMEKKYH